MSDKYTPTTEELMRGFSALPYMVKPREDGEDFSSWLSRCSIDTMHSQIASESAARRWLLAHDREVQTAALKAVAAQIRHDDSTDLTNQSHSLAAIGKAIAAIRGTATGQEK